MRARLRRRARPRKAGRCWLVPLGSLRCQGQLAARGRGQPMALGWRRRQGQLRARARGRGQRRAGLQHLLGNGRERERQRNGAHPGLPAARMSARYGLGAGVTASQAPARGWRDVREQALGNQLDPHDGLAAVAFGRQLTCGGSAGGRLFALACCLWGTAALSCGVMCRRGLTGGRERRTGGRGHDEWTGASEAALHGAVCR